MGSGTIKRKDGIKPKGLHSHRVLGIMMGAQGSKRESLKSQSKTENERMWSWFGREDEGTIGQRFTKAMASEKQVQAKS